MSRIYHAITPTKLQARQSVERWYLRMLKHVMIMDTQEDAAQWMMPIRHDITMQSWRMRTLLLWFRSMCDSKWRAAARRVARTVQRVYVQIITQWRQNVLYAVPRLTQINRPDVHPPRLAQIHQSSGLQPRYHVRCNHAHRDFGPLKTTGMTRMAETIQPEPLARLLEYSQRARVQDNPLEGLQGSSTQDIRDTLSVGSESLRSTG